MYMHTYQYLSPLYNVKHNRINTHKLRTNTHNKCEICQRIKTLHVMIKTLINGLVVITLGQVSLGAVVLAMVVQCYGSSEYSEGDTL